ncbi:tape measure protein [Pseudomonas sp. F1_0610]|uniref:tape measure protein n=1 Tax=Pseudomonas sp. F1_0610 TaxID=3114284 RepID=UPI0039C310A9
MADNTNLKLALRIQADMKEAIDAFDSVANGLNDVNAQSQALGRSSSELSGALSNVGETAEQQKDRIAQMVRASLEQAQATQAMREQTQGLSQTQQQAVKHWQATYDAQNAAMRSYAEQEQAERKQIQLKEQAAAAAAKLAEESESQRASLVRLLESIDPTERALNQLDIQQDQLNQHFKAGRIDAEAYAVALAKIDSKRTHTVNNSKENKDTAAATARAATEADRQSNALRQLLATINPTSTGLKRLSEQEQELRRHFKEGRLDVDNYKNSLRELRQQRKELEAQSKGSKQSINAGIGMPSMIKGLAQTIVAAFGVREVAKATESYTAMNNRLALVTSSTKELANAQDAVYQIAQNGRQPLNATAELYQRIATNADELKLSGAGVASVVDIINKTLAISGASSQASSAALIQLGQAFASGTLRGEELNSVLEQAPALAKTLADGLGVTVGELRKLGSEGKLSAQNVIQALQSQGDAVDKQFAKVQVTGSQAMTVLGNSFIKLIGEVNEATGATSSFSSMLVGLAEWIDTGSLSDGLIESFSIWSGVFDAMSKDIQSLELDIIGLAESGSSTGNFIANAFKEMPANLRAFIKISVVEILSLFDKAIAYAVWAGQRIKSVFTDTSAESIDKLLDEKLAELNSIRDESLSDILAEREAIVNGGKASLERFQKEREERIKLRAEREKDIVQLRNAAKATPLNLKAGVTDKQVKAQESYVKGLERQAAILNKTAAEVRAYELAEKKLSGAMLTRAQSALATIAADEQKKQADANAKAVTELQAQLLKASGKNTEAAMVESAARFAQMQREMIKNGNSAGVDLVKQLIPLDAVRIQLDGLQSEVDKALSAQQRGEQSIDAQVNAGLITQIEGRKRLAELHQQTASIVERYMPQLREMANLPGALGEQARITLETLEAQLIQLKTTSNELQNALRNGLQNGISESLAGLAKGTMDLRDAIRSLLEAVLDSMVQMAAQGLAETATSGIMSLFSKGDAGSAQGLAITTASTQGATAMGTAISSASMTGAQAFAAAITSASAANGASSAMSTAGGMASSGGGFWASLAGSFSSSAAFAEGGHVRGAGTDKSDSIPAWLSNNEFVTRASVVKQPGALAFLSDFNARGMRALLDWTRRVKHSTGGLAGIPAPAFAAPKLGAADVATPSANATLHNQQSFYLVDDPDRVMSAAWGKGSEEKLIVALSKDPAKFRSILGVN